MSDPDKPETISFDGLNITATRVSVNVTYSQGTHEIWYEFDRAIHTTPSLIALALTTLCGTKFDLLEFDFEIDPSTRDAIAYFSRAEVQAPTAETSAERQRNRDGIILSFSGGFDSIAAKELMPAETHLVSLDLGGWFAREAEYFQRYEPITVRTNIRQIPDQQSALARNHWLFMASGAILCSDHLDAGYHTFGSILGEQFASPAASRKLHLLEAAGLVETPVTAGITEVGTAKIMLETHPDEVAASLKSLAGAGDRKHFYKQALVTMLSRTLGLPNPIGEFDVEWEKKIPFDRSYTTALSTLYFIAKGHKDLIEPLFLELPAEVVEFGLHRRMDFMTRINPDFYEWTPRPVRDTLFYNFSRLNLLPYTEHDWEEVHLVRHFLEKWFA